MKKRHSTKTNYPLQALSIIFFLFLGILVLLPAV